MKYQPLPISKTYRRFVALAGKVQRLLESGQFKELSVQQQKRLACWLRLLCQRLSAVFSQGRLRRILASGALILGLGGASIQAQQFAPLIQDPFGLEAGDGFLFMAFADLDNDGDQDLMTIRYDGATFDKAFVYYQNVGSPQAAVFAAPQTNPFGLSSTGYLTTPYLVDIDNDGDQDLFAGTYNDEDDFGNLLFFENQGTPEAPSFADGMKNPFGLEPSLYYTVPVFADLDNDGDLDFLGTSYNLITQQDGFWYQENFGSPGAPQFGASVNSPFGLSNPGTYVIIHAVGDLDMDGDYDVLAGGAPENDNDPGFIAYLENTGSPEAPAFGAPAINPFGIVLPGTTYLTAPTLVDIDDDGDLDLFSFGSVYNDVTGEEDSGIWYFENTAIINSAAEPIVVTELKVFPTLTNGVLNWHYPTDNASSQLRLEAITADGRRVKEWQVEGQQQGQLNVGHLPAGLYHLRLSDERGRLLGRGRFLVR